MRLLKKTFSGLLFLGWALTAQASHPHAPIPYALGVFPHLNKSHLSDSYQPVARDLSLAIDYEVKYNVDSSFDNFYYQLRHGHYDIALVHPFDYELMAKPRGYEILAGQDNQLKAVFAVRPWSDLESIEDLRGKTIAMPRRKTSVSFLANDHLHSLGWSAQELHIVYESSHMSCIQKALLGIVDACATAPIALQYFKERLHFGMKVIGQTGGVPHALFVVHKRLPQQHKNKLRQRLLQWNDSQAGQQILQNTRMAPLRPLDDSAFTEIRAIIQRARQF